MAHPDDHEELVPTELRMAAEYEMRRTLEHPDSNRASKRAKTDGEEDDYLEVGRFDYSAIKDVAAGLTCFFATCDFRREKSTTREVTSLLKPYLLPSTPAAADDAGENDVDETKALPDGDGPLLSILKIGCRGLVLLKLNSTTNNTEENQFLATAKRAQQAVLKIYDNAAVAKSDSDSAVQQKPVEFIQRLVPILSTCAMEEDALKACAARVAGIAALEFGNTTSDGGEKVAPLPPTFGIHINNRELGSTGSGGEGTPSTSVAVPAVEPPAPSLERMQIISAVAAGLTTELKNKYNIDAKVNLKAPTVVVNVEILPIMGKTYAGIAILPQRVCNLKPKLGIKPLRQNNDTSGGSGKGKAKKEKSAVPS